MSTNAIWELIAKKLSGEASDQELLQLENLLKADPAMHYPMQTLADIWHQPTPPTEDAQAAYDAHEQRMQAMGLHLEQQPSPSAESSIPPRKRKYLIGSLAFAFVLVLGYYIYTALSVNVPPAGAKTNSDKSEVSTKYGSRTKLLLPDGTQVWLNSGSKLSYDKTYGNGLREVALSGEAYFDVVKNAALPFIIHTGSIDIKVLGTAFNVKSFPGEKNTETSLIRGSIEVTIRNRLSEKIILKPNEKLVIANEEIVKDSMKTASVEKSKSGAAREAVKPEPLVMVGHLTYEPHDSTVIETSWMENKLIFRSETLEELAVKMERWYGVSIRFADEAVKPKKCTGIFENETIQQALTALQLITPFAYTINKGQIIISSEQ